MLSDIDRQCTSRFHQRQQGMDRAVLRWSSTLSPALDDECLAQITRLLSRTYTIYGSMLLLPPSTIDTAEYQDVCRAYGEIATSDLYGQIAKELKITHIAVNRPIPPHRDNVHDPDPHNNIRAPLNFEPLLGDFGPSACSSSPSVADLSQAYWVIAKQNGIYQSWAPRWTMFSRGNISEKARVLTLPSVQQAVSEGSKSGTGCAVVDLYAGIGYFTFSYAKAGADKVLCWELNEWSCEGLHRGARANRWKAARYNDTPLDEFAAGPERILIFNETNELASQRIEAMRALLPPIRHINCGLLPTSRPSYSIAFAAVDPILGGWVHVHENFGVSEIDARALEVRAMFQDMLEQQGRKTSIALLENINRVKTYAPGVFHCVLDIYIPPS